jgi:excisionase family DNA binding protein
MANPTPRNESPTPSDLPKLVRVSRAAEMLAVSSRTVWRMIASGELRTVRIGRSVRVLRDSIEELCGRGGAA